MVLRLPGQQVSVGGSCFELSLFARVVLEGLLAFFVKGRSGPVDHLWPGKSKDGEFIRQREGVLKVCGT